MASVAEMKVSIGAQRASVLQRERVLVNGSLLDVQFIDFAVNPY